MTSSTSSSASLYDWIMIIHDVCIYGYILYILLYIFFNILMNLIRNMEAVV